MSITPTRRVTINPNTEVLEILSIYNYTESEIRAAWFGDEEMGHIPQRCFNLVQQYNHGSRNSSKYCMRGLEGHTTTGSIIKRNNRTAAFAAVFDEQERHWDADEADKIQAISAAYRRTTSSCQMWAHVVGNRDQQAVEAYLYDDDEDKEERTVAPRVINSHKPPAVKSPKLGKATRAVVVLARAA